MQLYKNFRPTAFDCRGLALPDQQNWLVAPVSQTRDSGPLEKSNFATALKMMGGESDDVQVHRFGHWDPGWFEIIIVNPDKPELVNQCEVIEASLQGYPILDEMDYSQREIDEAEEVWRNCYSIKERIDYIRNHSSQFEFHDFKDMIGCVRGEYFRGYASELIN